jgi:segregation and condensation protein A
VTLTELIEQIQQMAVILDQPSSQRRGQRPRVRPQSQRQAAKTIAGLAHSENLTEMAESLEQFLERCWLQVKPENDWLKLEELIRLWTQQAAQSSAGASKTDRVGVFWALLLLSAQSKVELSQEEFYQDLDVRFLAPLMVEESSSGLDHQYPV